MQSPEIDQLSKALVAAQAEFSAVPKGSDNPFFKSKYAALPDVVATTSPVLAKHGLAVTQFINTLDTGEDALTTYVLHESGQFISHQMRLHLPKQDPQGQGSAVTYARRYAYMSALGVVADVDDDGNAASQTTSSHSAPKSLSEKVSQGGVGKSSAGTNMATEKMCKMIWAIAHKSLSWDDNQMYSAIKNVTGKEVQSLEALTFDEAKTVIEHLQSLQN